MYSNVSLAMTRLAIVDLEDGHQPFSMDDEAFTIVFNGEIYNNIDLRKTLQCDGAAFSTNHSEVEMLCALYKKYGEDMLDKLNGMFSLAIYDKHKQEIFIARDRFGIKPLYYYHDDKAFMFSSELKVLEQCVDSGLELNDQSVVDYFNLGSIQGPGTIYSNIYQLPSAHWLRFSITNYTIKIRRWWELSFIKNNSISDKDWPIVIREGLENAIKRWATSDVPISYLLSGGLDSSSIVSLAARTSPEKIRTYTLGFSGVGEEDWNEVFIARDVVSGIDSDHTEIMLESSHLLDDLDSMVYHLDQPYGGGLPSWEIYKAIADNEKVAVNGTGGDEIFGNYNRSRYLLDSLGIEHSNIHRQVEIENFFEYYRSIFSVIKDADVKDIINPDHTRHVQNTPEWMFHQYQGYVDLDIEDRLTKLAMETQMTDEFLMMADRFSMAHSLEVRTPYLDHEFINLVLSVPTALKIDYNNYKVMLRRAVGQYLPESVLKSKKRGLSIPLSLWMRKPLYGLVNDLLSPSALKNSGILTPVFYDKYVKPMLLGNNNYISLIWSVLMFQLWLRNKSI